MNRPMAVVLAVMLVGIVSAGCGDAKADVEPGALPPSPPTKSRVLSCPDVVEQYISQAYAPTKYRSPLQAAASSAHEDEIAEVVGLTGFIYSNDTLVRVVEMTRMPEETFCVVSSESCG